MVRKYRKTFKKPSRNVATKSYVQRVVRRNVENKFWEQSLSTVFNSVGTTWVETDVTAITQGSSIQGQIGREIKARGLQINGIIQGGQTNTAADDKINTFRIVVGLYDSTGATPLQTASMTLGSYISPRTTRGMIRKYMDKVISLPTPGRDSTGYLPSTRAVKLWVKLSEMIKKYADGPNSQNKRIVVSMLSDSSLVPNPGFTSGRLVLFYEDA